MTKSITISYNEADESVLMSIFKKFKVKTLKPIANADNDMEEGDMEEGDMEEGVPLEVAHQMVESLKWIKQVERGEVEPITWEQMMAELEAEKAQEVAVAA